MTTPFGGEPSINSTMATVAVGSGSGVTLSLTLQPGSSAECDVAPGRLLRGRVTLLRSDPVKIRALRIRLKGVVESDFLSGEHRHTQTRVLCDESCELLHQRSATVFSPGEDGFEFELLVPPELPPSFEGAHGSVRYTLKAVADIPFWLGVSAKSHILVSPGQSPPNSLASAPLADMTVAPLSVFAACWPGAAAVATLGVAAPSRLLSQDLRELDVHTCLTVHAADALHRTATLSLVRHVTYAAGGGKIVEETTLGSAPVLPEVADLPSGARRAQAPPALKKSTHLVLQRSSLGVVSFNAAETIRVDYKLVLALPLPWAFSPAKASVPLWCHPAALEVGKQTGVIPA